MRTKILIENNEVDLTQDVDVQITYAINDIRDVGNKNTSFTKTIVLPGTAQNNFIFGSIFNPQVQNLYNSSLPNVGYNFNAGLEAECLVYFDNIQVLKGVIRLLEVNLINGVPEYQTSVIGELGGLAMKIGDKYLTDLDFSAYDHNYTATNIQNSWDNSATGYYYPVIDYGYTRTGRNMPLPNFRPAFFVNEYIDKIMTDAGYTWEIDKTYIPRWDNLIIPHNGQFLSKQVQYALNVSGSSSETSSNTLFNYPTQTGTQYFTITGSNTRFTWNRQDTVSFNFEIVINFTSMPTLYRMTLNKNGVEAQRWEYTTSGTKTEIGTIQVSQSDYLEVRLQKINIGADASFTTRSFKLYGVPYVEIPIALNEAISVNNQIPRNIKQKDFLVSVLQMFNIYVTEDKLKGKHLILTPFPSFYNGSQIDWTYKLDYSKAISLKPLSENNSRFYEFKYKDDTDYYNDIYKKKYGYSYGNRVFDSNLDFVKEKKTVELLFSPSPMFNPKGDEKVMVGAFKSNGVTVERTATNIRILYTRKMTGLTIGNSAWSILNGTTPINLLTTYGYAGHLSHPDGTGYDLNFGAPSELYFNPSSGSYTTNNLFNDFWSFFLGEITDKDSKMMTAYFKLTLTDVYGVDFGTLININGSLWRLNKIIDFDPANTEVTKCELIKVIDRE